MQNFFQIRVIGTNLFDDFSILQKMALMSTDPAGSLEISRFPSSCPPGSLGMAALAIKSLGASRRQTLKL